MGGLGTEFWLGFTAGVALATLGGVAWLCLRFVRRERDLRRSYTAGGCARCGYDVRSTSGRCPECGDDLLAQAVAYWRDRL